MAHYSLPYLPATPKAGTTRELAQAMTTARQLAAIIRITAKNTHDRQSNQLGSTTSNLV